jgi:hypothetical protein
LPRSSAAVIGNASSTGKGAGNVAGDAEPTGPGELRGADDWALAASGSSPQTATATHALRQPAVAGALFLMAAVILRTTYCVDFGGTDAPAPELVGSHSCHW